jgi:hypothetical protein
MKDTLAIKRIRARVNDGEVFKGYVINFEQEDGSRGYIAASDAEDPVYVADDIAEAILALERESPLKRFSIEKRTIGGPGAHLMKGVVTPRVIIKPGKKKHLKQG